MNCVHKFNNIFALYSLPIIFSKIFSLAACARSIAFYPPRRNESMQCALPTPFIAYFSFLGVIIPDSFKNSLKTGIQLHKIAYTMSKHCLRAGGAGKGGRHDNGGNSAMVVGGIDAPGFFIGWFVRSLISRNYRVRYS